MAGKSLPLRILGGIARWLDRLRRTLHLAFMLLILVFLVVLLSPSLPVVPPSAALVLRPEGALVDELSGDPLQRALAIAQGLAFGETLLADLIEAVRTAAEDERIRMLVLDLDGLSASGLSKLQELATEIEAFRRSGKPVYAVGNRFDRDAYLLAAHADRVLLNPMGEVLIDGYSSFVPYYKSALEKLYIDYHAWTVGEYKSFVEPATRDGMSEEDREARSAYLDAMWDHYQSDVEAARGLAAQSLQSYADEFVTLLRQAGGDTARLALDFGLVDELLPQDLIDAQIRTIVGANGQGSETSGYSAIGHRDYLAAGRAVPRLTGDTRRIGLVVAAGTILDGMQPPGSIGGESLSRLIREAREDGDLRGLVLRVDSPGGSAFASEQIRREIELFRASGRPVVVSMGSVAASGGYWIASGADEIWASPSTLTGSIGVGATFPSFERALDRLGVHIDGIGTTALSGQMDPMQGLGEDIRAYVQLSVERTYAEFIDRVAMGRALDAEAVEAAARGRVWIGSTAADLGLVDRLGGLAEALDSAAELAGLAPNAYRIEQLRPEPGWAERLGIEVVELAAPAIRAVEPPLPRSLQGLIEAAIEPLAFLDRLNDPRGIYAYCFCDLD